MAFISLLIKIIWVCDVINLPQFEFMDTTTPINFLGWVLIFIILGEFEQLVMKYKIINKQF